MNTKLKLTAACLMSLVLSSCATVFSGSTQSINVKVVNSGTQDLLSQVSCNITDGSGGDYGMSSNPAQISVNRGSGNIVINCHKAGYRQLNMAVGDSFNGLTIVNVLFWPGFLVDVATGAYKKYPSHYQINMEKIK